MIIYHLKSKTGSYIA